MDHLTQNDQHYLAQQLCIRDIQQNKASLQAVLIIKRWKLIRKIPAPGLSQIVQEHTERLINRSFFSYIPNQLLLVEDAYFNQLEN